MCDLSVKPSGKWLTRLYVVIFVFFSAMFVEGILLSLKWSVRALSGESIISVELLLVWLVVQFIAAFSMCYSFSKILAWAFRYGATHPDKFGDDT